MKKKKIVTIPISLTILMLMASACVVRAEAQQAGAPSAYRLIGTIEGKGLAGAVIVDAAGAQTFFRLHDTAPDGSRIIAVGSDSILLKRPDGTRYELFIIHDMMAASPSRPATGPASFAPEAADIRRTSPDRQRFAPRQGGPGPAAREETEERHHNKPDRNAVDQGAGRSKQNYATGPNSSAAGTDQAQRGPHPRGRRQPPGMPVSD